MEGRCSGAALLGPMGAGPIGLQRRLQDDAQDAAVLECGRHPFAGVVRLLAWDGVSVNAPCQADFDHRHRMGSLRDTPVKKPPEGGLMVGLDASV